MGWASVFSEGTLGEDTGCYSYSLQSFSRTKPWILVFDLDCIFYLNIIRGKESVSNLGRLSMWLFLSLLETFASVLDMSANDIFQLWELSWFCVVDGHIYSKSGPSSACIHLFKRLKILKFWGLLSKSILFQFVSSSMHVFSDSSLPYPLVCAVDARCEHGFWFFKSVITWNPNTDMT